ncbi:LacI family DNA-binding transcriptional regulator [Agromyces protaetiae]|uniref:LacI family DNA-binding transcriptional regulator n=1 Tax=Agromyces protaetiae TaxID=2509455 RepID=A0A4P6F938_9MICO|nr:LacI family DNA-binding transcriptional regulator [Agromyces protaetiae]QAY72095.1 LacI family DNA-binding transcriptional regulator [Agromyces protaetiae]
MAEPTVSDPGRTPSIRDVARVAEVSHQTVSRVLNNHPSIRPETKQRVLEAMEQLQYRPNRAARALVTSRSRTIGVLLKTDGEYGPTSSVAAIENVAREQGYWVHTANLAGSTPDAITEAVEHLMEQAVEGIIVIAPQVRVFDVLTEMAISLPCVSLQTASGAERTGLAADQVRGARIATEHLIALGHHEILHLAGPQDWIEAESRMRGFLDAISDADLPTFPPILGDWTAEFGYFAGRELARRRDFTAVFAANDLMAIGLMHGFRDAGLDVPRAVSVVGFDDIPVAPHVWPPLTTVHQDFRELGIRAVELLLRRMRGEDLELGPVVEPALVARDSTAAPLVARPR